MAKLLDNSLEDKLNSLHELMYDSAGMYYIKDHDGNYLYANKNQLSYLGSDKPEDMFGRTDYETPWARHADILRNNDHRAIKNENLVMANEVMENCEHELFLIVSHKKPFLHNGKVIGVCGTSLEVCYSLDIKDKEFTPQMEFLDIRRHNKLKLTVKQKQALYYILQGLSAKDVANRMFISKRTIEHHLEAIKYVNNYASLKEILLAVKTA